MGSTTALSPSIPITIEKPTKHTGDRNKTVPKRMRKISRSGNLDRKVVSMSGTEQGMERREGGIIEVTEKGNNGRGDEMSLGFSFPQFCATCEKQILPLTTTNFFALKGELETSLLSSFNVLRCRLYDSPTDVSVI